MGWQKFCERYQKRMMRCYLFGSHRWIQKDGSSPKWVVHVCSTCGMRRSYHPSYKTDKNFYPEKRSLSLGYYWFALRDRLYIPRPSVEMSFRFKQKNQAKEHWYGYNPKRYPHWLKARIVAERMLWRLIHSISYRDVHDTKFHQSS